MKDTKDGDKVTIQYTENFEDLLKAESEKAEVMSVLHTQAYIQFNRRSIFINIPVIILSSIIGFMAPLALFPNQSIMLGGLSILVAILKTIDNFFDWTKRSEGHRMVSLNYVRISKFIQIQLALEKECRILPHDILSIMTNDLQNLKDSEPVVPANIVEAFKRRIHSEGRVVVTALPPICNGLTEVKINRPLPPVPEIAIHIPAPVEEPVEETKTPHTMRKKRKEVLSKVSSTWH